MLKQLLCILAGLLVFITHGHSQPILIPEHIEISNSRAGNHLRTIFEDSRGLIWAGTMNDLVRYDGFSVKRYAYKPDSNSYQGELIISSIAEDPLGNIWCSSITQGALVLPVGKTGFGELIIPKLKTNLPKTLKITFDKQGNLWGITIDRQLFSISKADSSLFIWPLATTNAITVMGFDAKGNLWYSTTTQVVYATNPQPGKPIKGKKIEVENIKGGYIDTNGIFLFESDKVLRVYYNDTNLVAKQLINLNPVEKTTEKRVFIELSTSPTASYLIAATNKNPVLFIDKITGEVQTPKIDGIKTSRFEVYSYLISSNRLVYIGTNKGFLITTVGSKAFAEYTDTAQTKFRCAIAQGPDTLLFGTMGSGIYQYVKNKQGKWQKNKQQLLQHSSTTSSNIINRFYRAKNGVLWACANSGLYYYKNGGWQLAAGGFGAWGIAEDNSGNFWVGGNTTGLTKYTPATNTIKRFYRTKEKENEVDVNYNRIWQVKYYNNKIYLGTAAGLILFDPTTEKFTPLFSEKLWLIPVWDFYLSDSLWIIPTQGKGLWSYKPQKNTLENIDSTNTILFSFEEDEQKNYWIIADKGVIKSTWPLQQKPTTFSTFDGLNTNYLSFTGIAKLGTKQMVFCGEDGFTITDITLIENNSIEAAINHKIFISSLKYADVLVADYLANNSKINLNYTKGRLLIDWAATHTLQKKQYTSCFYKLDGFDDGWNTNAIGNNIIYNNLPPGRYVLKAYLGNSESKNPKNLYSIVITITPPFWLTLWFKILVAFVVLSLITYLVFGWVLRQKLKQSKLKSQIEALRSQINPHFIFNALNSIQAFIYAENSGEANEYLSKFARLMRKILENSREEIISIEQELNFIGLYLEMEALRFRGSVTYTLEMAADCKMKPYKIPSMIVQPIVENALKHGFNPTTNKLHIAVKFWVEGNAIVCEVTDTGQGFAKLPNNSNHAPKSGSLGLQLVKERLDTLSKIYGKEYRMVMGNMPENKGAYVKLIIPQHD
jgi:ligand-binding sensor domain-containing protein